MNKFVRGMSVFCTALALSFGIVKGYEFWLDCQLAKIDVNELDMTWHGWDIRDKGHVILDKCVQNGDVMLLGSSELSSSVPQNAKKFFPNEALQHKIVPIGGAYAQDLVHALKVCSMAQREKLERLGIIVSLQWFYGKDISIDGTAAKFSELHFYDFMFDSKYSDEEKHYVASRVKKLLRGQKVLERPWLYSRIYLKSKTLAMLSSPFFRLRQQFLILKDKHDAYKGLKRLGKIQISERPIDWVLETEIATSQGQNACTNNDVYVADWYFDKYLRPIWSERKNTSQGTQLLVSNEHGDFKFFLEVCKKNGVKPYVILMSTNGWDYDYTGLTKDKRDALYQKLENQVEAYGFECLNLADFEYTPYFYFDIMHLGWKGWLYVDEKLAEHFQ